jgi:23S rRNA (guanine2445-N2)-methyltransferase
MSAGIAAKRFFASCPRGLEPALADELAAIGADAIEPTDGGVAFVGEDVLLYRANLESRIASRILAQVGEASYRNEEDIYRSAHRLPWHEWFERKRTIRIAVAAARAPLKSLDFVTLRIKDAVCDAFRKATGARPSVDTRFPDVRIHAFIDERRIRFYLDTSGEPLFKRGWRTHDVDAPLRENLAAGILRLTGWTPEQALLDPMCGGGTFALEAAADALGIAPGANRGFGFERLSLYDARLWRQVRSAAESRRRPASPLAIHASDNDPRAIRATAQALERAGLKDCIHLERRDVLDAAAPAATGVLIANPPYGVRIGESQSLAAFYPRLGDVFKQRFAGWRCFVFTADTRLPKLIGLRPSRRTPLFNGALECRLYEFAIVAGSMRPRKDRGAATSARPMSDKPHASRTR